MTQFRIRRATPEDANALSVVGAATFLSAFTEDITGADLVHHCQYQHSPAVYAGYLNAQAPEYACWIAEAASTGAPVGYAVNCPPDLPTITLQPGDVELKRIYVLNAYHGAGVGKALASAAETHARSLNAPRLLLGVYDQNHRAIAFYRKSGFEMIGTRQFRVGDQLYDDLVMARDL